MSFVIDRYNDYHFHSVGNSEADRIVFDLVKGADSVEKVNKFLANKKIFQRSELVAKLNNNTYVFIESGPEYKYEYEYGFSLVGEVGRTCSLMISLSVRGVLIGTQPKGKFLELVKQKEIDDPTAQIGIVRGDQCIIWQTKFDRIETIAIQCLLCKNLEMRKVLCNYLNLGVEFHLIHRETSLPRELVNLIVEYMEGDSKGIEYPYSVIEEYIGSK